MSRSELYVTALIEFLNERQSEQITERLNQVYDQEPSTIDPVLVRLQASMLAAEKW
jgi:hypothetical protein